MSYIPSAESHATVLTADGAGACNAGPFKLGSFFRGISFTFAYAGAGTPAIEVLVSNNPLAVFAGGRVLQTGLNKLSQFSSEARFDNYWIKVTGMIASDAEALTIYSHRWP